MKINLPTKAGKAKIFKNAEGETITVRKLGSEYIAIWSHDKLASDEFHGFDYTASEEEILEIASQEKWVEKI